MKIRLTLTGACPSRRFTGMSRAIPGPLRAKGTSPLGTPGRHHCASAHLSRCTPAGSAYVSQDMQDMYSVQRNILPRPKPGCANRSEVAPAEPCNSLAGCCTDPRYESQSRPLPSSAPSRASSQAARMARSIPFAVNLMIRPVERLTA